MGVGLNRKLVGAIALVACGLVAAGVPGSARAHRQPPVLYQGTVAATAPTIDGTLGDGEWAGAPSSFLLFGELSGSVRFRHDSEYLYVALTVADGAVGAKSIGVYFDDDHDGVKDPGEDVMLAFVGPGNTGSDFYYSAAGSGGAAHYNDVGNSGGTDPAAGGTNDVIGAGTEVGGQVTFELRHSLCSTDDVHDICLEPGDTTGVHFQYQSGGPFWGAPGASSMSPGDWADLTLSNTGQIVFESTRDGQHEIYRMNADGSGQTRLTNNPAADSLPSISPNGRRVAFTSNREGSGDIFVMNIDGSGVTRLTSDAGQEWQPAWSPDGTKIAYNGTSIEQVDIFVVDAAGGTPVNVTNTPADEASASWSPDGTQLAFTSSRDGNNEIYRGPADGSGTPTRLTNNSADDHDPDWSPDGQKLAFYSDRIPRSGCCGSVWTINASDGSGATNLSGGPIFDADPSWSPDGTHIAFVRDFGGQNFHILSARADGSGQVRLTTAGTRNSFPDWGPAPSAPSAISITGPANSRPGAVSARIVDIPLDAIRGDSDSTAAAPLGGIPLGGIPLGGIPLGGIPLGGIPLGGIGFTAANLNQNGLGGVPLSTIPLTLPDTWEAHLALDARFAGTPPQNVTLAQVLGTPVVAGVSLNNLNLAASPLGGIPLAGIALGGIPLGGIPLGGIATATEAENLDAWCAYINQQPGYSCASGANLAGQTMIGLALQGVPLGGIPLGGIPLGGIPLGGIPLGGIPVGTPLGGIPLGGINLTGTPLGGIPLGGINLSVSPLGGIPLGGIPLGGIPLGGIPLGGIPLSAKNAILICPTGTFVCADTDTLAAAKAAGAIRMTATLRDLGYYKDANGQDITLENLGYYKDAQGRDITLAQLVQGLPADTTLADLLATVLLKTAYDWEALPLARFPLQDFSADGGIANYTVAFTVNDVGAGNATVRVDLPPQTRYVPNSTQISGGEGVTAAEPTLIARSNELVWSVTGVSPGTPYQLTFRARPGLRLGTESATAELDPDGAGAAISIPAPTPASTAITEPHEPQNEAPATAQQIASDTLYLGYTSSGQDKDFFQITAAPGEQLTINLSHLQVDDDLVVYGPTVTPLRTPHPGAAQPIAGDVAFDLAQRTQSITPEALTDVPQTALGQPVLDVSDNRGLADEEVAVVSPDGGTYTIQVSSFDGGYSNEPWMLRVERASALPLPPSCTNPPTTGAGVTKPMPAVPATANTLYLFASKRFGDLYGLAAENEVWTKLQTLAARTDAAGGAVIPVDADADVLAALEARATGSCSPAKANAVVRAVGALLDNPLIVTPTVKHVVVVGDDAVFPFGRILDNTAYANERGYASTFFGTSNNQYLSTYALGFLPTDDPLGDVNYRGQGPYVPELALGRLVETPAQIISQVDQYVARNGTLAPTRALTMGYDFLKDGSTDISSRLKAKVGATNAAEVINDTWSKTDLLNAMFPATNAPQIASLNAHYDHYRSLPADENAAQRETILFTTADLLTRSTSGRVVFTMGCHSALPVSDFVADDVLNADWPQAYAQTGAVVYMGNTGFGLGDTAAVLYSEKLNVLFAERLDGSMTVGQALSFAKQEYAATPTLSGYHLKVIDQATMMGLPMYRVGTGGAGTLGVPAITSTDSATGLPTASFSVSPSFTLKETSIGDYYSSDDIFAENRRPIQPTARLDVTQPGLVAHGALITGLTSSDETNFDAAFSRVVDDLAAFSPELVGDVTYPTKLQSIATIATPTGTRQRLGLFTGQFRSDGTPDAFGIGTQRKFTGVAGDILYAPATATDFTPASFGPVEVTQAATTVGFAVDVEDNVGGALGVKRVLALYRDASNAWKRIELSRGSRWSGAGTLQGTTVEWYIQAVDASGNVAVTANKSVGEDITPDEATGDIEAVVVGLPQQQGGWYKEDVDVEIRGAPGIKYSLDGAQFTLGTSLTVSGTGVHSLDFQGSDNSRGSLTIPIDTSNPTVTVNQTYGFGQVAHAICSDSGSGIETCTVPDPLDTSSVGTKTIPIAEVRAEDRAGHVFVPAQPITYTVLPWPFEGFYSPVNNLPTINEASAGSSVPVKFSLLGFRGLNVFATGYPASQPISCSGGTVDPVEEVATPGSSGFSYDPALDRYKFVWKTERSWRNTCRQLIVRFRDGTEKRVNFRFR
jgi:WD40 repeat protein